MHISDGGLESKKAVENLIFLVAWKGKSKSKSVQAQAPARQRTLVFPARRLREPRPSEPVQFDQKGTRAFETLRTGAPRSLSHRQN